MTPFPLPRWVESLVCWSAPRSRRARGLPLLPGCGRHRRLLPRLGSAAKARFSGLPRRNPGTRREIGARLRDEPKLIGRQRRKTAHLSATEAMAGSRREKWLGVRPRDREANLSEAVAHPRAGASIACLGFLSPPPRFRKGGGSGLSWSRPRIPTPRVRCVWQRTRGRPIRTAPGTTMKNASLSTRRSLLAASALLLILSFFFPYVEALQASSGQAPSVQLAIYPTHSRGPLREQLAMAESWPRLEHSAFTAGGVALTLLLLAILFAKRPWASLLCLPAMLLPATICADASNLLAARCGRAAACEGEVAARAGTGAHIAWGAAALLAMALLLQLWRHAVPRLPLGQAGDGCRPFRTFPQDALPLQGLEAVPPFMPCCEV